MRLRLIAAAALCVAPAIAADPELLNLTIPNAQLTAGVNFQQSVLSPLGQYVVSQAPAIPLAKLVENTGFDPRRDLREILISFTGPGNGTAGMSMGAGVFLARGTFDIPRIIESLQAGSSVQTYKGVSVIDINKQESVAFPDSTLAISGAASDVRAAIDRRTAPTAMSSAMALQVNQLSTAEDAWFISTVPISQFKPQGAAGGPNPLAMYEKLQQVNGGVKFGANVVVSLQLVAATNQDASLMAMGLMAARGILSGNSNPQLAQAAEILKGLNVTTDGPVTKISWSMPEAQIEQMIQTAQAGGSKTGTVGVDIAPRAAHLPSQDRVESRPESIADGIRVDGAVQQAKLLEQPPPVYPPLAKQARVSGVVRLKAIIAQDGTVEKLTVLSGHPLLVPAAMQSVKQWVYQPTLLNGKPVKVATQVEVNFTLEP